MNETDDPVGALLIAGQHEAAAMRAQERGEWVRAARIFETLWQFERALPLAIAAGDRAYAVRLALEARAPDRARAIAAEVPDQDREELVRVSDAFAGRGAFEDAAHASVRAGDLARAADLYRRAGSPVESARLLARLGRLREAAQLLEILVSPAFAPALAAPPPDLSPRDDPGAAEPPAHARAGREQADAQLVLGQILARLGRPMEATRALQAAARHDTTQLEALRGLCGTLLGLGFTHAANTIGRRIHRMRPDLPPDPRAISGDAIAGSAEAIPERFVIERLLGGGATGRVYRATDRFLGRTVALKLLSVGASGAEETALRGFLRESEAAGRLRHPHIVALYDADPRAGLLVLEHLPGGSLADVLADRGRLTPSSTRRLALEILDALAAAHAAGIVHRDVKPSNIFFDAAGGAKLGDFGAAHLLDFGQTQTGGLIGTLAYLSPEQVSGGRIGPAADLYAMAATLFEALTGRPPFLGSDLVDQHLSAIPPRPSDLVDGIDAGVDHAILTALAKVPDQRFASAGAMADAIRAWPVEHAILTMAARPMATIDVSGENGVGSGTKDSSGLDGAPAGRVIDAVLGATAHGRLLRATEARVGRTVVVEEHSQPFDAGVIARARLEAALGGPHVQRVLALDPDCRHIVYEHIEARAQVAGGPPSDEAAAEISQAIAQLALNHPRVVATPSGPVLMLQPPVAPPPAAPPTAAQPGSNR